MSFELRVGMSLSGARARKTVTGKIGTEMAISVNETRGAELSLKEHI